MIAFIPARGGSQGISNKNIKHFCGRPLIYWNLKHLSEVDAVTKIVVATDSELIENTVLSFSFDKVVVYQRKEKNAQNTSSTESVMMEFLEQETLVSGQAFMLVQCTSPFTSTLDFKSAIKKFETENIDSVLSCARIKRFIWNEDGRAINYDYRNRPRRQDFQGTLMENGAFYINTVGNIKRDKNRLSGNIGIYEMPEYTSLELDEVDDWVIGEQLMKKHVLNAITNRVKLFLSDIDGVLTDAGMYYSENGDELKKFSTYDGMAFELLRVAGVKTGIVTAEDRLLNKRRSEKLKVDYMFQGVKSKLDLISNLCVKLNISLEEVAYIGDDINDHDLLCAVGLAACPSNARSAIKNIANIIHLETEGGSGAVREFAEIILEKK